MKTHIVGDHCVIIHDHYRPLDIYNYGSKDDYKSARTVNLAVFYDYANSG